MYLESRPGIRLANYVEKLWYFEGYGAAHRRERVLPNGRIQLIIDLAPAASATIVGLSTTSRILETASLRSVMGVVFRPGGTLALFDPPADEFSNRDVALEDVWKSPSAALRGRLLDAPDLVPRLRALEAELERRIARIPEPHSSVRYALREFARNATAASVMEVARQTGLSRRRLGTLFREQVGLTPKLYCRLHRFQQVVRRIAAGAPIDWAQVALDGGYYDQSHMAHEFREFAGVAPGVWRESERPFLNHAVID